MRVWLAIGVTVWAAFALAGCGFQPLYGKTTAYDGVAADFGAIEIVDIPERVGLSVRNHLIDLMPQEGAARYRLIVTLSENREGLALRRDASVTRYNYVLRATFELRDAATDAVVDKGHARAIAAYNVVDSQFATLSAEQDAETRAARELAEQIRLRLGVGFERRTRG